MKNKLCIIGILLYLITVGLSTICAQSDTCTDGQALTIDTVNKRYKCKTISSSPSSSGAEAYVMLPQNAQGTNTDATVAITANTVTAWRFYIDHNITVTELTFHLATASAGGLISFGVYSSDGNTLLINTGTISTTATGTKRTTFSAIVLSAGFYWLAWTADNSTCRPAGIQNGANFLAVLNGGGSSFQQGTAGNASALGVLPTTLGGVASGVTIPTPYVKLQG